MRATRAVLGTTGVVLMLVGGYFLFGIGQRNFARLVDMGVWLAGGVVLHDGVIAPLVLLVGFVVVPRLPWWSRGPVTGGLIVLLSVTLLAIPVLGRFGARPDVPSLLNRPYGLLWLGFALVVVAVVVAGSLLRRRAGRPDGTAAG